MPTTANASTTTAASRTGVIRAVLEAFSHGDLDGVLSQFADDVVVRQASGIPHGGTHSGRTAFLAMLTTLDSTYKIENEDEHTVVTDAGDVVLLRMNPTFTSRSTGRSATIPTVEVYTVTDGRIVDVDVYYKDTAALRGLVDPE